MGIQPIKFQRVEYWYQFIDNMRYISPKIYDYFWLSAHSSKLRVKIPLLCGNEFWYNEMIDESVPDYNTMGRLRFNVLYDEIMDNLEYYEAKVDLLKL